MNKRIYEIEQCFLLNDYPRQNKIYNDKLIPMLRMLGHNISEKDYHSFVQIIDPSGNGFFELEDFKNLLLQNFKVEENDVDLKECFNIFDRDNDGFISLEDLRKSSELLKMNLLENDLEKMFNKADKNKTGKISYDQFESLLS